MILLLKQIVNYTKCLGQLALISLYSQLSLKCVFFILFVLCNFRGLSIFFFFWKKKKLLEAKHDKVHSIMINDLGLYFKFDLSENTLVQVIKRPHTLLVELIRIGTRFYIAHQFHIKCLENIDIDLHEYCTPFNYIPHMFGS